MVSYQNQNNNADQLLVEKVLRGDRDAYSIVIRNTERLVSQIIFKMINNAEDRKDLAQDVYLKVFKSLPRFRFEAKLSTWIAQVAYNSCLSYIEKKKLVLVADLEIVSDGRIDANNNTEPLIFFKQSLGIVNEAVGNLDPILKTLITLYHTEDLSYAEIVQITGLPLGTIKSYLFRARKALKEDLMRQYKREEL